MEVLEHDVIIIGAGAAGMMCAIEAGKRGRRVWLIDHASKIGEKIRISGGGRCNFTNLYAGPENYLSQNPHFCKSALKQYTQHDFIQMVEKHDISYHEKHRGQLFCDEASQKIIDMLLKECAQAGVKIEIGIHVEDVKALESGKYQITANEKKHTCQSLVIATGGLSIPKIGATKFGYGIAKQFGIHVVQTRPGLVPLTFQSDMLERCKALSGLSVDAEVTFENTSFSEGFLFTHRGLSGPSILQISSYWKEGAYLHVNLAPEKNVLEFLKDRKKESPKQNMGTALAHVLPKRLAESICDVQNINGPLAEIPDKALERLAEAVCNWRVLPSGTEGYRTAEVTLGGIDTKELSSKTMEAKRQKGLYFIGEVVDVTGHLGGFNFQWAWSSGYAAGQNV